MKDGRINIVFTIPNFKTAGSQFVLLGIYERLDRSVFKPYVLVEKFPDHFPSVIPEQERLYLDVPSGKRAYIFALSSLLKEKGVDIVHSWDYKSNSIEALACRKARVKYIYTKKNNAWSKRWFAKSVLASHIVYNNPEMKERFFSGNLLKKKISFIPHGVNVSLFSPLGTPPERPVIIGCIGVVGPNKNQLQILQALTQLPQSFHLHLYGKTDPNYKELLDQFIAAHGLRERVSFCGYIENHGIPQVMASFHVLVLASIHEGLPLCIIEAMACEVPVLSSNSGGGARYLLEEGKGGYVYYSTEELVAFLLKVQDPEWRSALGKKGRVRIQENFTIEKEVFAYQELYKRLVN